tara:strand:+ start:1976 stop:2212 length:237 start_codon:yes stop_codon:yes gene_type:complete
MAKQDYTLRAIKDRYKALVKKKTLTKVSVTATEKRSRAELLDMVEEMFESKSGHISAESLRAFLHILVKSTKNSNDDR